ncbi:MAG: N-6 DNA methylase [candidate division KSB1 bacterium]|nr:N-6 DNA methylase [candidate division KSB1 bacterium]
MSAFPAIRIEGGLFGPDLLDQLLAGAMPGQRPQDFGLTGRGSLTEAIGAAFSEAGEKWKGFQQRLNRLPEGESDTLMTQKRWVVPLLSLLGYHVPKNQGPYEVDGLTFAISHRAGENEDSPPIHIVGARQELGRVAPTGRPRLAPHSLVQEFLNRTEHLWGLVTNGLTLRLLRDSVYIRRQAYIEFDLGQIFEDKRFNDFAALYRLLHRTRLPQSTDDAGDCLLEKYYQHCVEQGGRVRDRLRDGVEHCIKRLADGFLAHPGNQELRERLAPAASGPDRLSPEELYRQLLRIVYRFLFLLVSEDRGLISADPLYREHYGVARLRGFVDRRSWYTDHDDLWHSLRVLWKVLSDEKLAALVGAAPLNGELLAPVELDSYAVTNRDLLEALWHLVYYRETPSSPPRRVNYGALDVEELGSVYESLLDYHPDIDRSGTVPQFALVFGSERKSTGSYYTAPQLVAELIRSALEPVLHERLSGAKTAKEKEAAILSLRVLDPACGSGHFLLAAARRLGKELARVRTGEEEPAPEQVRPAIRDVIAHCIYGVDKNPLAVELARVALWLEAHYQGMPLTFLDHRIKCGDSLVGVLHIGRLKKGVPDEAYKPLSADDRQVARAIAENNREQRQAHRGYREMLLRTDSEWTSEIEAYALESQELAHIPQDSLQRVREMEEIYRTMRGAGSGYDRLKKAADLWSAAFFAPLTTQNLGRIPTTRHVRLCLEDPKRVEGPVLGAAEALAAQARFFHWPLEFPEVFSPLPLGEGPGVRAGFDVILANPPWERIKLQEQEFFASRDVRIAQAPNAAARKRLIERLPQDNPALWEEYRRALHTAESASRFLRASGDYPLTGRGDINTYSVFAERIRQLLAPHGRAGIILPTGIATDATNKSFFADLVEKEHIVSLFDFENREKLFPAVDSRMKFCLLTLCGERENVRTGDHENPLTLSFFSTRAEHLRDPRRVFTLRRVDIARINPNTRTLPVFRTRQDAELTKALYARVPVLDPHPTPPAPSPLSQRWERGEGKPPQAAGVRGEGWGVRFLRMLDMSNDSHLFRTRAELEAEGYRLEGNCFVRGEETYLPLYEAKFIDYFDHRFGSYETRAYERGYRVLPSTPLEKYQDPNFLIQPWYWVSAVEVEKRLEFWEHKWLLGFRNVTSATNERTAIFSLLPLAGVGHSMPLLFANKANTILISSLLANLSTIVFDYFVRQKVGGVNMTFGYLQQFPVLPPSAYIAADPSTGSGQALRFIVPRVLELTYTAWDLAPFAADVWQDADEALRAALQAQWQANRAATSGVDPAPPAWATSKGAPFPPFKWDESRRAVLRAELDAYYARLYGLTRKQLRYILDPADLTARELADILDPWEEVADPLDPQGYAERAARSDFPGETFRVLKEKELREYGEYRTRRLVLEAWQALNA